MKHQAMNPYLPLYEYIPDGEPRIFGERLYIYGSHDYAGGEYGFCAGDYMVWSAPLDDLGNWRLDGTALRRSDCPDGLQPGDGMAAPDVVRGRDGRYYLYYNAKTNVCHVAVSSVPEGPFTPYGDVRNQDGSPYDTVKMFDPGVLVDEDGRTYLYIGFCMPGEVPERFKTPGAVFPQTSLGFELEPDMLTIRTGPVPVLPGGNVTAGTGFEGHGFYEASSMRRIRGSYVYAYSSEVSHEMCYAVSGHPFGPFAYQGVLVSGADIGIGGRTEPVIPYGNVHGGMAFLNGAWYIFYHRHTSGQEASRQGCAEKLPIREDGWFGQAEITSCGLNDGPLRAEGTYNACYCCHLTSPEISPRRLNVLECRRDREPHIFEEAPGNREEDSLHYIANMGPDTVVGYKYFAFSAPQSADLLIRGKGELTVEARMDSPEGQCIGSITHTLSEKWERVSLPLTETIGTHALYFVFTGNIRMAFQSFTFNK